MTVLAASTYHEVELDVSSASDPTGVATHRGDTLTYRVRFRNSGGLPAPITDQVQVVMVKIPDGTTATATGSTTPGYEIVSSGGNTFAKWTLTKPLLPVDPEPAFTVSNVNENVLFFRRPQSRGRRSDHPRFRHFDPGEASTSP